MYVFAIAITYATIAEVAGAKSIWIWDCSGPCFCLSVHLFISNTSGRLPEVRKRAPCWDSGMPKAQS